jgi:predicted dehydrogenase
LAVDADDTVSLLLRMRSGVHAVLSLSVVGLHSAMSYRFEAFGSDGSITIDGSLHDGQVRAGKLGDRGLLEIAGSDRTPPDGANIPAGLAGAAVRSLALMLAEWRPALRGEPTPGVPTLRDGWLVQRVIDAARRSSAGAGWVALD